jgi:hypothetical protein
MFEHLYTSSLTVSGGYYANDIFLFWQPWGAALWHPLKQNWHRKVFKDGTAFQITQNHSGDYWLIARDQGRILKYTTGTPASVYEIDEFTGLHSWQTLMTLGTYINIGNFLDVKRDLLLRAGDSTLYAYKASTGAAQWSLSFGETQTVRRISWAGEGLVMVSSKTNGKIVFVNYLTQEITNQGKVDAFHQATYDPNHGVIMTLGTDEKIRIYHPTGVPYQFSGPTFSPATVKQWGAHKLTVQLLGSDNEKCPNWWIRWWLADGKGWLACEYSKTDADGYAYNYYFGPSEDFNLGSERVYVQVVI